MSDNYAIEETSSGKNLVVTGAWSRDLVELLRNEAASGLVLNYAKGFDSGGSLDFLSADLPVERLYVLDRTIEDATPISRLGRCLKHLSLEVAPGIEFDLSMTPLVTSVAAGWGAIERSVRMGGQLKKLSTTKYSSTDFLPLCTHTGLRRLQIHEAPELETLSGLRSLVHLESLRIRWAVRLHDLSQLHDVSATLKELEMERCRSLRSLDEIGTLLKLKKLEFGDGPEVPSLEPLTRLTQLEWAVLWGTTKVMDNDLTPLLHLPNLKVFRMQPRRSYHPSVAEIQAAIQAA